MSRNSNGGCFSLIVVLAVMAIVLVIAFPAVQIVLAGIDHKLQVGAQAAPSVFAAFGIN